MQIIYNLMNKIITTSYTLYKATPLPDKIPIEKCARELFTSWSSVMRLQSDEQYLYRTFVIIPDLRVLSLQSGGSESITVDRRHRVMISAGRWCWWLYSISCHNTSPQSQPFLLPGTASATTTNNGQTEQ